MAAEPGLLYVTAHPHAGLPPAALQDWYNNEHGPDRLRLASVTNGFRYRVRAGAPTWLAIYDIPDLAALTRAPYTTLREPAHKTARETAVMKQLELDRRIYTRLHVQQARPLRADETGAVLYGIGYEAAPAHDDALATWYTAHHLPTVAAVAGWLRSHRFRTAPIDETHPVEYLILHEFDADNGLATAAGQAAVSGPGMQAVTDGATHVRGPWEWELNYIFGPAPRELGALTDAAAAPFTSRDGRTRTIPDAENPAIESYVTMADGVTLPFRLEGGAAPDAPVIVLVNSILVSWAIWDGFVTAFRAHPDRRHFRILRYDARGRSADVGSAPVTLDQLADDLVALLDALRIQRAAAVVGVSLGGATALAAALHHPARVTAFVACDTNDRAPASNPQAWAERIAVAEAEDARADGEPVVGAALAEQTVRRWFVPASFDDATRAAEIDRVRQLVAANSRTGFKTAVAALYDYDLRPQLTGAAARGLFLVGSGDGVLPQTMQEMAARHGTARLAVIADVGHLPMVEQPQRVADEVGAFVCGT